MHPKIMLYTVTSLCHNLPHARQSTQTIGGFMTYQTVIKEIATDKVVAVVYSGPSEATQSRMAMVAQSRCNDEHYVDFIN